MPLEQALFAAGAARELARRLQGLDGVLSVQCGEARDEHGRVIAAVQVQFNPEASSFDRLCRGFAAGLDRRAAGAVILVSSPAQAEAAQRLRRELSEGAAANGLPATIVAAVDFLPGAG